MSNFNAESLSALMDGEAEELEFRRLLTQIESDSGIRARWRSYHAARTALQKELLPYAHIDISAKVRDHIENEAPHAIVDNAPANVQHGRAPFNFKPLTGLAVAASVIAVVFFGVQALNNPQSPATGLVAANGHSPVVNKGSAVLLAADIRGQAGMPSANQKAAERLRKQRMQTFMQLHAQQASVNSSQGMLQLARVARHEIE